MKNMRTVLMDIDALDILSVNISSNIRAFIYNQYSLTMCFCFMGKNGTI